MEAVERDHWLEILEHNAGFENAAEWVDFAKREGFAKVDATVLAACPDCGSSERKLVGQYVYYSSLFRLQRCLGCGLCYSDLRLNPAVIARHFEHVYKDEEYFAKARRPIFQHVVELADSLAPEGARIVDVGGANGHLLVRLKAQRSDLRLTHSDISELACSAAREKGLRAICSSLCQLPDELQEAFDVVLLLDVIYYEPDVKALWASIEKLTADGGTAVLRLPNKLRRIAAFQHLKRLLGSRRSWRRTTSIRWFNPEHVYVFTPQYLTRRFHTMGFDRVRFLPSPMLERGTGGAVLRDSYWRLAEGIGRITGGRLRITPAMIVVATKTKSLGGNAPISNRLQT